MPAAEPTKDELIDRDRKRLEGTWSVVSAVVPGAPQEIVDGVKRAKFTFRGTKVLNGDRKPSGEAESADYHLDPTKDPKEIDFPSPGGGGKQDRSTPGLYQLTGDELKLCLGIGTVGKDGLGIVARPKSLDDPQGALLILKRDKP
jgi:uncharacterized protein (TIGR03067 family)